jgi:hypothetical protein
MKHLAITRHELERRKAQLADLQRQLASEESACRDLREEMQAFIDRYTEALASLYLEHDALESQVHTALAMLAEALRRRGIDCWEPQPPKATPMPTLQHLPAMAPLPPQPEGGLDHQEPPTLKQLYRRAAMRLHPDLAGNDLERCSREQQMASVNQAYAAGDRSRIEALLLAAGESPAKVTGSDHGAQVEWLRRAEAQVQGRLRVVQAHLAQLRMHPMHALWQSVSRAEKQGLDPLAVMASRLRAQIVARRQELYIGQRLQPESDLAHEFVRRGFERYSRA